MKIGFLTDKNGYRAPIHPESIEKYSLDVHLEKDMKKFTKVMIIGNLLKVLTTQHLTGMKQALYKASTFFRY